jgi:secondary thiamine-phosphate synthase enzyme
MIEYEPGVLEDLKRAVEQIAPANLDYAHNAAWGDGNGYSHVRSALLGPSVSIPVHEGDLVLGTWQQVVLLDFDNKARRRRLVLQVLGE